MALEPSRWRQWREPLYNLAGLGFLVGEFVTHWVNPILTSAAIGLLGLPAVMGINQWATAKSKRSGETRSSRSTSPSGPSRPSSSGSSPDDTDEQLRLLRELTRARETTDD